MVGGYLNDLINVLMGLFWNLKNLNFLFHDRRLSGETLKIPLVSAPVISLVESSGSTKFFSALYKMLAIMINQNT